MKVKYWITTLATMILAVGESHAEVIVTTDASACPSIADHQKFIAQLEAKNWNYQYPSTCVRLVQGGRRYAGPFETREAPFGKKKAKFVSINVPPKGKLWTLASWVQETNSGVSPVPKIAFLSDSTLWYAKPLRDRFGDQFSFHGIKYDPSELSCLPKDITAFDITAYQNEAVLSVTGSLKLSAIPKPFKEINEAEDKGYMVLLEAYLFAPDGTLAWHRHGLPRGGAWVKTSGDSRTFSLGGTYTGRSSGYDLWVVAAGDPLLSSTTETRVLLGAKRLTLP